MFDIFRDTSPIVEPMSIDEAFIDVAGLWRIAGTPTQIATGLRSRVAAEVGLPITVGIARTKFLAKVASAVGKPDGLLVVEPDEELAFLHPLPVQRLWGVGHVTATKLHDRGIHTVADVAAMSSDALTAIVGRAMGRQLHALSHNRDARRVTGGKRRGSIGSQQALGRRRRSRERDRRRAVATRRPGHEPDATRRPSGTHGDLAFPVRRLQPGDALAHARGPDGGNVDHPLHRRRRPRCRVRPIIEVKGISLLGLSIGNLSDVDAIQLVLPFERKDAEQLDTVLDAVRDRFGRGALQRATTMRGDPGIQLPMLPD